MEARNFEQQAVADLEAFRADPEKVERSKTVRQQFSERRAQIVEFGIHRMAEILNLNAFFALMIDEKIGEGTILFLDQPEGYWKSLFERIDLLVQEN
ncbi:MAG: hypothetical protein ABI758_07140 [Candidatus Woesebacteria bacterium]